MLSTIYAVKWIYISFYLTPVVSSAAMLPRASPVTSLFTFVYRKGDIVKKPMKKGSFVPKNAPGVGWGGVGHAGVVWVM